MTIDINRVLKSCVVLLLFNDKKTIHSGVFQTILRILYMDEPTLNIAISNGCKYVTHYIDDKKINNYNHYKQIVKTFIDNDATELCNVTFKIDKNGIAFLAGVMDTYMDQVQQFN